ncbi:MAG: hypothetical protein ACRC0G_14905, partial [Fusobacteriaceae bacterium]
MLEINQRMFDLQKKLDSSYDSYGMVSFKKINEISDMLDTMYYENLNPVNGVIKIYQSYYRNWKNYKNEIYGDISPLENIKYHYSDEIVYKEFNSENISVLTGHIDELKIYCVGVLIPNIPIGGYTIKYFEP